MPNTLGETTRTEHSRSLNAKRIVIIDPDDGGALGGASSPIPVEVTSGGTSGTQYTEGDTDATITGTAIMWEDAGNTLTPVSSSNPLPVSASIDPTGLATSTKQDTIIGHVDGIETLLTTIDADTGNLPTIETNTDFGTVTGGGTETGALRVTIANNSTGVLSVDDNGSSITVDGTVAVTNSDITSIKTAVETIDNAISGNEMQVDVVAALPAGTNLLGRVSGSNETSTIYDGTTALTPKFAIIDAATSGDNTLVAAVTSKKIRVHALFLVSAGTVTARFESGAGGTALTGQMNLVANTGFVLPYNPVGWFETASNTLLNLELSGAISCDGSLVYTEV